MNKKLFISRLLCLVVFIAIFCLISFLSFSKEKGEVYFPLAKGMRWEYIDKVFGMTGKTVVRVDGTESIYGREYYKVTALSSGDFEVPPYIIFYRKTKTGIYVLYKNHESEKEELLIPFPIEEGKAWERREFNPISNEFYHYSCKIVGIETLEELDEKGNIKKIKNCLKISNKGISSELTITYYYAPGIGLIKSFALGATSKLLKFSK